MLLNVAVSQVEHYLSWNNFAFDYFLQSIRDEQGWIHLDVIQSCPRMKVLGVDKGDLATLLRHSRIVEVDQTSTRVRPKPCFRLVSPNLYGDNCGFFVDIYGNPYPTAGFFPGYYFVPHSLYPNGYFGHGVPQNSFAVPTDPCEPRAAKDLAQQPDASGDIYDDEVVSTEEDGGLERVGPFALQQPLTSGLNFDPDSEPFVSVQREQLPVSTVQPEDEHFVATKQEPDVLVTAELSRNISIAPHVEERVGIDQDAEEFHALDNEEIISPRELCKKNSPIQTEGSRAASRNHRGTPSVRQKNSKAEAKKKFQFSGRDRREALIPLFAQEDFPALPSQSSPLSTSFSGKVSKKSVLPLTAENFPSLPSTCSSSSSKSERCFDETAEFPPLPGSGVPCRLDMKKEMLRAQQQAALFPLPEACKPESIDWSPRSVVAGSGYWLWRNSD